MLYRLSYSLGNNPTDGVAAGNTYAERIGMHELLHRTLLAGLLAISGGAAWAQTAVDADAAEGRPVVIEPADDGTVLLHGSVATIRGTTLRWEPQEKKQTLGFWTKAEDAAEWTFTIRTVGDFDVEVLQGCGTGQGGSEMAVTIDAARGTPPAFAFVVEDTGGFQAFRPRIVGRVTFAEAGVHTLRIKPERIAKQAACDIRQIRLVPVK